MKVRPCAEVAYAIQRSKPGPEKCQVSGDHIPAVRQLASSLGVNQNTVIRAYTELEQEKVIVARRGGGTIVVKNKDDASFVAARQRHLSEIISDDIIKSLSLGYSPEELEAAFYLHLSR